ncbi:uncharacterized protein LOC124444445 [Xenia sp. Carnegie-2017]|uniref:uncharacterized protein LOC124444445 n=1 Tax=Xenia sp. Carnegie-2017 TaxID=2897299 RepID=UPI001F04F57E|nr:uncharacterized protein LOC124444445 [Xenia sp. Carnegie-2017]
MASGWSSSFEICDTSSSIDIDECSGSTGSEIRKNKGEYIKGAFSSNKRSPKLALNSGTLDVSRNDDYAMNLTYVIEAIFLHGYQVSSRTNFFKKTSSGTMPTPDFWELVHSFTHNDVIHQLAHLSHITSHIGLCRAWLRLALNDGLLESYFHAILADKKKVHHSYTSKSLLRDDEAVAILLTHLSGLIELTFDFNYNTPSLNQWTGQSLQLSGVWEPPYAPAATISAKVTEKSGQLLTVPKVAILSNVSSMNDLAEDKIVQQETKSKDENTTHEHSNDQDIEIVKRSHLYPRRKKLLQKKTPIYPKKIRTQVSAQHNPCRRMKLLSLINNIAREKGLDGQNYKCHGCSRPIGMIYGQYKVCCFDGSYYCYECHVDDEHVIPSKIVHNWDLSKYKVAKHVKLFLMQIDEEPLFHIDEVNSTLYNAIGKMKKAKHLRMQLQHMKGYVMTCKNSMIFEDVRRRMWPRDYLWDDIHQYSLLDLIQVNSGQLHHHIRKIISFCKKHVYECEVCSQKGFICEICKDSKILYPFEVHNTLQCSRCKALFHKHCKLERSCPRCIRRRSRSERMSEDMNIDKEKINDALNPLL